MELINATRMVAGYTMGLEPSGRELLVIAIKGTFALPKSGEQFRLHETQLPLVMADTFTGAPGLSAPVYEVDFAPTKRMCDVLLIGSAYAPGGRPATRVTVGLRVGPLTKTLEVVGDRVWQAGVTINASDAQPFISKPISYDVAFGGVDQEHEDPKHHAAYMPNPVGRGFRKHLKSAWVDGKPLPSTEEIGEPVTSPNGTYQPMSFGPIGRGWQPRSRFAGTYDQQWLDEVFPFLPKDFDERYYQAAPADQQIALPKAPLQVALGNLTVDGTRHFELPFFEAPVNVFPKKGDREDYKATLDTIVIEPDQERL
ncbi:MAG TPA: DUF2169 domain-containing protein, partial [Burkholderiaceae bacterium]|nr:DUF2169 domain-containing protein [Burkholderiaceae bacterium]